MPIDRRKYHYAKPRISAAGPAPREVIKRELISTRFRAELKRRLDKNRMRVLLGPSS